MTPDPGVFSCEGGRVRKLFSVRSWPGDIVVGLIFLGMIGLTTIGMMGMVLAHAYKLF